MLVSAIQGRDAVEHENVLRQWHGESTRAGPYIGLGKQVKHGWKHLALRFGQQR